MNNILLFFFLCTLIGSLPFGELIARALRGKSVMENDSRNSLAPGEMFAILGIPLGIVVCCLDALKGFISVFPLAIYLLGENPYSNWWIVSLGGLLTVIAHCNSPLLGFKGGRGLSPIFGVMLALLPVPAVVSLLLGLALAFWGLSSKPGALSAAGAMPLLSIAWIFFFKPEDLNYLYITAFMSLWTMWEHRSELKSYLGLYSSDADDLPAEEKEIQSQCENSAPEQQQ